MEEIIKKRKRLLIFNIVISALGVLSIPGIVLSAVNHIIFLMIICIAIVAFDFYGLVFLWLKYGSLNRESVILKMIINNNMTDFEIISKSIGYDIKEVKQKVLKFIEKGYLKGFYVEGNEIKRLINKNIQECPYCGAKRIQKNLDNYECPYCGAKFNL